jgi:hypothetical protein
VTTHQLDVKGDVSQLNTFTRFINFIIFGIFDQGLVRLRSRFEGYQALGYTEAHQPFQRRLVDAEDDAATHVLAEEESKRRDQG